MAAEGAELLGGTPEAASAYVRDEIEKWAKVVRFANAGGVKLAQPRVLTQLRFHPSSSRSACVTVPGFFLISVNCDRAFPRNSAWPVFSGVASAARK